MRNIWIISDTHFLHDEIIDFCGRPADHSFRIFKNLRTIPEKDILIHLGDISMGKELVVYDRFIKPLKCSKILVKGNHDNKSNNWYLEHGWDFVCYSFTDNYFGKKILFSHYPKPALHCDYNLHGHLHNNVYKYEHLTKENQSIICDRHLLFSCEATKYRPLTLNYILDKVEDFRLINKFKN